MIRVAKNLLSHILPSNIFDRSIMVLASGTIGAQGILVLAAPFLTRIYSPEAFGVLAIYTMLLTLIVSISSLSYQLAIPISQDEEEVPNLAALSLVLVCVSALLTGLLVLAYKRDIAELLNISNFESYLFLLPIGVLLAGCFQVFLFWNTREKLFTEIARTRIRQALASVVIQIAGFNFGAIGLLLGQIAGQSAGTLKLAKSVILGSRYTNISWRGMASAAVRYRKFPLLSTWGSILNSAGTFLPTIFIATFFGPGAAGFYALANRVAVAPLQAVGGAVSKTFFAYAKDAHQSDRLGLLVSALYRKLTFIVFLPTLIISIIGPGFFSLIFGEKWQISGELIRLLALWVGLQFVVSPLTVVFFVTGQQKKGLIFQGVLLVFRILGLCLGVFSMDLMTTITFYSAFNAVCYLGCLISVFTISQVNLACLFLPLVRSAIFSLAVCSPLLISIHVFTFELSWIIGIFGILIITPIWVPRYRRALAIDPPVQ